MLAVLLAGISFGAMQAHAVDATWTGPGGEWTDGTNWSSNPAVPDGTATFDNTGPASVQNTAAVSIGAIQFTAAAPAYTFAIDSGFQIIGAGIFNNAVAGQTFNVGSTLTFQNASTASGSSGAVTINVNAGGILNFNTNSTAASSTITNNTGGTVNFSNSSTADFAIITNTGDFNFTGSSNAGGADITNLTNGVITFSGDASAGGSTIRNQFDIVFNNASTAGFASFGNGAFGIITFNNTANAGSAGFNNSGAINFNDQSSAANGFFSNSGNGTIQFAGESTAASATFINTSGTSQILFVDQATAGNATISNTGGFVNFGSASSAGNATIDNTLGGIVQFLQTAKAGTARISNDSSNTIFGNDASAENATIINNSGGSTIFGQPAGTDAPTAGSATITNNNGGQTTLFAASSASNATIINNFGGSTAFGQSAGTDTPTAANANITNNDGGQTTFFAASSAGSATITTNSGGATSFFDNANGGSARFIANGTGVVDFSNTTGPFGDGQITAGSIEGSGNFFIGAGNTLTVGGNNLSTEVSGVIADFCGCAPPGSGSLVKAGTGTLALSGLNTYTGATTVNVGTLLVNGSIVSSSLLTVNAGATLGGIGALPTTVINGTLSPGNSIGTITVNGNLTFVGAGNYLIEVSPAAADRTNVTGTTALAGTLRIVYQNGTYLPATYTLLSATGGRTGTFSPVVEINAPAFTTSVTYTNTDVLLTLTLNIGGVSGLNQNQSAVSAAIQSAFNASGTLPAAFFTLASQPGSVLPGALTQVSGEIAAGAATAGFQSMDQFLNVMLDPFLETRLGDGTVQARAIGYAPEARASLPAAITAYAGLPTKAPPLITFDQRWTVWGTAFGGAGTFKGDTIVGSADLKVRGGSFAAGVDYRASPNTVFGIAVAGGTQTFNLDGRSASGRSDVVQGGAYGSTRFGSAYLSAALAYGRHDVSTERNVAFGGIFDRLTADYNADHYGGRVEAGYRFAVGNFGVTPYAAAQAQRFQVPNYGELTPGGPLAFALTYLGRSWSDTRSEVGARLDYRTMLEQGALLTLRARGAWGHEFDTGRVIDAAFQALPGFGFTVTGASPAADVALVSAGAELKFRNGVALRAKFDGEFAGRTQVYAGSGGLYVSW